MSHQSKATLFDFVGYDFNAKTLVASFDYAMHMHDGEILSFTEKIILPHAPERDIPKTVFTALMRDLHLALGVSYYKTFCPEVFKSPYGLVQGQVDFWNMMYSDGLGEFLHHNGLKKSDMAQFEVSEGVIHEIPVLPRTGKLLVGIGGGKDSIVSVELLKERKEDITGFLIETNKENSIARKVMEIAKIPELIIKREIDAQLIAGVPGAYNGHVPLSAFYAFIGNFVSALYGFDYFIVSNEYSSNFGNLENEDADVNHQWSKSSALEEGVQSYTRNFVTPCIGYFSLLRPLYEIRIVKMFAEKGEKYFDIFSSCNVNFKIEKKIKHHWCGVCPKCAFAFTMLSAFLPREKVENIFGKNLFNEASLTPLFRDMLGFGDAKPFDCVGVFDEVQAAMYLARKSYADTIIMKEFLPKIKSGDTLVEKVLKTNQVQTIPAEFIFYGMETALILGYGKEGQASEKYMHEVYPHIKTRVADSSDGDEYLSKQSAYDIIIKTPGISKDKVHAHYTTATNIFFSEVKKRGNIIIGITGSKGKSTVSTLIYSFLKGAKIPVRLLGNIGNPMLEALLGGESKLMDDEVIVCELSSYQLDDIQLSPDITVVTNLFPDHLDYHGSWDAYINAKKNSTNFQNNQDAFIYNADYTELKNWAENTQAQAINYRDLKYKVHTLLAGEHNIKNIQAAITAVQQFNIPTDIIDSILEKFTGLSHRIEMVGEYEGIHFYDDAIATTPESVIAALEALPNTETLFLGGTDRGYDFTELESVIMQSNVKNIVLFPETGERMFRGKNNLTLLHTTDMKEAIAFAYIHTSKGKICLLSPASPSYSLYKNFEERGDLFKKEIEDYEN